MTKTLECHPQKRFRTGLPSLITDWGGYASFPVPGVSCQLVPISMNERGLFIASKNIPELIEKELLRQPTTQERRKAGKEFAKYFGIKSVAKTLDIQLRESSFQPCKGL